MVSERARTVSLVVDWLDYLALSRALAPNTIALYRRSCFSFIDECVRDRALEEVTTAEIEAWLQRPRAARACGRRAKPAMLHRNRAPIATYGVGSQLAARRSRWWRGDWLLTF
jgi:site-specific recombinase XerD